MNKDEYIKEVEKTWEVYIEFARSYEDSSGNYEELLRRKSQLMDLLELDWGYLGVQFEPVEGEGIDTGFLLQSPELLGDKE